MIRFSGVEEFAKVWLPTISVTASNNKFDIEETAVRLAEFAQ